MQELFQEIDWQTVTTIALVLALVASNFLLYRSIPRDAFNEIVRLAERLKDVIPGTIDDLLIEAGLDVIEDEFVRDEDDNTNA